MNEQEIFVIIYRYANIELYHDGSIRKGRERGRDLLGDRDPKVRYDD